MAVDHRLPWEGQSIKDAEGSSPTLSADKSHVRSRRRDFNPMRSAKKKSRFCGASSSYSLGWVIEDVRQVFAMVAPDQIEQLHLCGDPESVRPREGAGCEVGPSTTDTGKAR